MVSRRIDLEHSPQIYAVLVGEKKFFVSVTYTMRVAREAKKVKKKNGSTIKTSPEFSWKNQLKTIEKIDRRAIAASYVR